jgi:hypothetical protein
VRNASDSNGTNVMGIMAGVCVIMISFFGGFLFMIDNIDTLSVGGILFFILVVPMIGCFIGLAVIMRSSKWNFMPGGMFKAPRPATSSEVTYVEELPTICPNCKASIATDSIEWVGPLTAKCPYCGSAIRTEKRRI